MIRPLLKALWSIDVGAAFAGVFGASLYGGPVGWFFAGGFAAAAVVVFVTRYVLASEGRL